MWTPKLLNEAIILKEKFKMASNFTNPKVSLIHKKSKLPFSKSILGPYVPKSTILNSSPSSILGPYILKFPPFHHPSRCVSMTIFPPPSSTHSQVFQPSIYQPCLLLNHSTPLIQNLSYVRVPPCPNTFHTYFPLSYQHLWKIKNNIKKILENIKRKKEK